METSRHGQGMSLCRTAPAGGLRVLAQLEGQITGWGGNSLSSSCRSLDVMFLADPALVCVGNRPFTGQIFTEKLIIELA